MNTDAFLEWLHTDANGRDLAARERDFFTAAARDIRGQAALQLELSSWDTLADAPVSRRLYAGDNPHCNIRCDIRQLPFAAENIDAVSLPHTLEWCAHPQQILHEAQRILRPEGRLIITAFNPYSPWFFSRHWNDKILPLRRHCIRIARLKDWLDLLGFDIIGGQFMVYTPMVRQDKRLKQLNFLNHAGDRWLPQHAAAYGLIAIKRMASMRLIKPQWRERPAAVPGWVAPAKIANKHNGA